MVELALNILCSQIKLRDFILVTMAFGIISIFIGHHEFNWTICIIMISFLINLLFIFWIRSLTFWFILYYFLVKSDLFVIWIENMLIHMIDLLQSWILFYKVVLCKIVLSSYKATFFSLFILHVWFNARLCLSFEFSWIS